MPIQQAKAIDLVFDLENMVSNILKYAMAGASYAEEAMSAVQEEITALEAVKQTQKQIEEYNKLVEQLNTMKKHYNQVIVEYVHLQNQMTALALTENEWKDLANPIKNSYGSGDFALTVVLNPNASDYSKKLRSVISSANMTVTSSKGFEKLAKLAGANEEDTEKSSDYINASYQKYANQQEQVARNYAISEELDETRKEQVAKLKNLGGESQLATLQLISAQLALSAKNDAAQRALSNQILQAQEPESIKKANQASSALFRQLSRQYTLSKRKYDGNGTNASELGL